MIRRTSIVVTCACALTLLVAQSPLLAAPPTDEKSDESDQKAAQVDKDADDSPSELVVDYRGKLQDGQGKPISGIFHFNFKLYDSRNAAEPLWNERQYVAVTEGDYLVPLGRQTALSRTDISGERWIGVELVGEGEILRDRFQFDQARKKSKAGRQKGEFSVSKKTKDLLEKAQNSESVAFADVAERAVSADKAEVAKRAQKVGSMSAEKIKRLSNLALERLGEHIADPDAHKATGKKLGDRRRVMDRVGGTGGASYEVMCPPGYVVTGVRGGAGRVVDSYRIICQPLK